ncbi:MAG: carbohydrate kinase [Xanthomonadales bacterium]|nr:carbohydrate kinase [Gammaproteobacteria bacterium]MBT8072626.1 carbohydrate kinase [Gammaproteobacteria bacterium]NNK03468.1 carbohydrate kinase [Xanthomonadales bacterium]NNK98550.1 carbohydrate kinase [Xanthomonadales bacterium]
MYDLNSKNTKVPVIFGEVLFDCFPDGSAVIGGAPFNVAWHLQAFGLSPVMVSSVGEDELGKQVRDAMSGWQMDTRGLQTDSAHPTGSVKIEIVGGEPHYTIVEHRAYDYIDGAQLPDIGTASVLYHGTLALRNGRSREALEALRQDLDAMVLLDVNLRDPWWRKEDVLACADAADWIKLNQDELKVLGDADTIDDRSRAQQFLRHHGLAGLVVTLGENGAFACTAQGGFADVGPAAIAEVVDTVGAGDAFTSVLILGLSQQWPLALTLQRAQDFATRVVAQRGATIHERELYKEMLRNWS